MANYTRVNYGDSLFFQLGHIADARPRPGSGEDMVLLALPGNELLRIAGSGLEWDNGRGGFSAGRIGTVTLIARDGRTLDTLTGLDLDAAGLADSSPSSRSGDDHPLARVLLAGADSFKGSSGTDRFTGSAGADIFDGGSGSDWVSYAASPAGIAVDLSAGTARSGDAEGDTLISIENIEGTARGDTIIGNGGKNIFIGFEGDDVIHGAGGDDTIRGNIGNDFLTGGEGRDKINGGPGNDLIDAGPGQDIVFGGSGNDVIYGGPDPDVICFNFRAADIRFRYDASDYSIWVEAPDGTDHIFSALTIATTTGTYRFDVPSQAWVYDPGMTTADWMNLKL